MRGGELVLALVVSKQFSFTFTVNHMNVTAGGKQSKTKQEKQFGI